MPSCLYCGKESGEGAYYHEECKRAHESGREPANAVNTAASVHVRTSANAKQSTPVARAGAVEVRVVDVEMSFGSMVVFMVKWAIASIPAFIILFLIFIGLGLLFAAVFYPLGR